MKTIHQLRKLARRIPRIKSRSLKRLMTGKNLTDGQVRKLRGNIAGCEKASVLLERTIEERNITGAPFRDATPHKQRRSLKMGERLLSGLPLAA